MLKKKKKKRTIKEFKLEHDCSVPFFLFNNWTNFKWYFLEKNILQLNFLPLHTLNSY